MERYLASLTELLADPAEGLGLAPDVPVMVMEASGGLMTVASAREKPVHTVLSGPAGGVVASAHVARLSGFADIITLDMGGTSTDISLVLDGRPQVTREASLAGTPIRIPVIDINAIGAGGGSIAWIDEGGALRVGPQSAEAVPGPACYGRGGAEPTVTDANLVLGRLGPDTRLGGELTSMARPRRGPSPSASPARSASIWSPPHPASCASPTRRWRAASASSRSSAATIRAVLTLVPFGGAGPMHGSPLARELRVPRLLVPPTPGILCALGMLVADLRHDLVQTRLAAHRDLSAGDAQTVLAPMVGEARRLLAADRVPAERQQIELRVDMRYIGQSYELPIPLAETAAAAWAGLAPAFHAEHLRRFAHSDPASPVEVVSFAVTATGLIDTPELPRPPQGEREPPAVARRGTRRAFFEATGPEGGGGWAECPVWQREALLAGNRVAGPAIVEEVSATTVLYPGDQAYVDAIGSLVVEVRVTLTPINNGASGAKSGAIGPRSESCECGRFRWKTAALFRALELRAREDGHGSGGGKNRDRHRRGVGNWRGLCRDAGARRRPGRHQRHRRPARRGAGGADRRGRSGRDLPVA